MIACAVCRKQNCRSRNRYPFVLATAAPAPRAQPSHQQTQSHGKARRPHRSPRLQRPAPRRVCRPPRPAAGQPAARPPPRRRPAPRRRPQPRQPRRRQPRRRPSPTPRRPAAAPARPRVPAHPAGRLPRRSRHARLFPAPLAAPSRCGPLPPRPLPAPRGKPAPDRPRPRLQRGLALRPLGRPRSLLPRRPRQLRAARSPRRLLGQVAPCRRPALAAADRRHRCHRRRARAGAPCTLPRPGRQHPLQGHAAARQRPHDGRQLQGRRRGARLQRRHRDPPLPRQGRRRSECPQPARTPRAGR